MKGFSIKKTALLKAAFLSHLVRCLDVTLKT